MRKVIAIVAIIVLMLSSVPMSASTGKISLYVDWSAYYNTTLAGVKFETPKFYGFTASIDVKNVILVGSPKIIYDPVFVLPVKTMYSVGVRKELNENMALVYHHHSAHWHNIVEYISGEQFGNRVGLYGDTSIGIEYKF